MAHPKQKLSKSRTLKRAANHKATAATVVVCTECGTSKRAHFACTKCGAYDKKRRVTVKAEKTEESKQNKPKSYQNSSATCTAVFCFEHLITC